MSRIAARRIIPSGYRSVLPLIEIEALSRQNFPFVALSLKPDNPPKMGTKFQRAKEKGSPKKLVKI